MTDTPPGICTALVVAEMAGGAPTPQTLELLSLAGELSRKSGGQAGAILLTAESTRDDATRLIAHGADRVFVLEHPAFAPYLAELWLPDLSRTLAELHPRVVMLGQSLRDADLAPRLAFRIGAAIATGCVGVMLDDGGLHCERACHGGKVRETLRSEAAMAVVTVRARSYAPAPPDPSRTGTVQDLPATIEGVEPRVEVKSRSAAAPGNIRLEDALTVVGCGRGLKSAAGLALAAKLAGALNGALGATRMACDMGMCSYDRQIGLSGVTIAPDLYIALGVSGAGQHMVGCQGAKTIVAVNNDPEAPIFAFAHFGVVGDAAEFLQALIPAVQSRDPSRG